MLWEFVCVCLHVEGGGGWWGEGGGWESSWTEAEYGRAVAFSFVYLLACFSVCVEDLMRS